jgi:tRNA-specific 2-thiouridylase
MKKRAVALFSGGLDSILAAKLIMEQGVEVVGLHIKTGFHSEDVRERLGLIRDKKELPIYRAAEQINLPLVEVDISDQYCEIIENPKYGYGKYANPCIDCKIKFFKTANKFMEREGFDFVVSGDVLKQRPMSQNLQALQIIEKEAGLEGLIVRPLSAKLLPPTIPEQKGWIDREKLLDIYGRGRKKQLELAKKFGLTYIPQPAGGCILTMEEVGKKVFDLLEHNEWNCETAKLVPVGRHFRLPTGAKVIVARNKEEANYLKQFKDRYWLFKPTTKGTVALLLKETEPNKEEMKITADLVSRYSKREPKEVEVIRWNQILTKVVGEPIEDELIGQLRLRTTLKLSLIHISEPTRPY